MIDSSIRCVFESGGGEGEGHAPHSQSNFFHLVESTALKIFRLVDLDLSFQWKLKNEDRRTERNFPVGGSLQNVSLGFVNNTVTPHRRESSRRAKGHCKIYHKKNWTLKMFHAFALPPPPGSTRY